MKNREEVDLSDLESKLTEIIESNDPFENKIDEISISYAASIRKWSLSGNDRILSKMRNLAAEYVEKVASEEVSRNDSIARLESIAERVEATAWLPEGFKTSIGAALSFARAGFK